MVLSGFTRRPQAVGACMGAASTLGNESQLLIFQYLTSYNIYILFNLYNTSTFLDSTIVSIYVDVLVELTNTICQFNQYNYKYWTAALSKLFVYFFIFNIYMGAASIHGNKVQLANFYNLWSVRFLSTLYMNNWLCLGFCNFST